jgi:transcriptional regulator with XRE-family HTH domain
MKLLDHLIKNYGFKNDRAIALNMKISIGTLSKIRTGKLKPSASIIIKIHEQFGISIAEIKALINEGS